MARLLLLIFLILSLGCDNVSINGTIFDSISSNAGEDIILSNGQISNITPNSFDVAIDFEGDVNADALVTFFYCNKTDSDPDPCTLTDYVVMTRSANQYVGSVSGLSTPYDAGDVLTVKVFASDPDGVTGSPYLSEVTLPITNHLFISNLLANSPSYNLFNISVDVGGDANTNSSATAFYCSETTSPGCDPLLGDSIVLALVDSEYVASVSGLLAPYSPGSVVNVSVVASDPDGVTGSPVSTQFTIDSSSPPTFNITGVTNSTTDVIVDDSLCGTLLTPVINWEDTNNETSYEVTVFESNGSTVACAMQSTAADVTSYDFSACTLTGGNTYKAQVVAKGFDASTVTAANSLYSFTVVNSSSNPNITISDEAGIEGTEIVFTVTLSEPVCSAATNIDFTTDNDIAKTSDSDYTDNDNTLIIPLGQLAGTITVATTVDSNMEFDETFTVNLSGTDNGAIVDSRGVGTILNDDDNGYIWTGATDSDWNTGTNWSGNSAPPNDGSVVVGFTDACVVYARCDVSTPYSIDVAGLYMFSTYTGTVTQSAGHTIDVGDRHWLQSAGTFVGGDSNITLVNNSRFYILDGSFTSTTATMKLTPDNTGSPYFKYVQGTFNHNNGSFEFISNSGAGVSRTYSIEISSPITFNNLKFGEDGNNYTYTFDFNASTIDVIGNLLMQRDDGAGGVVLDNGTLRIQGNIAAGAGARDGSALLLLNGSGVQTYSSTSAGILPHIEVNKLSGSVAPLAGTADLITKRFTLTNGVFTASPNTMKINTTSTSPFNIAAGTTFNHNNGTLVFETKIGTTTSHFVTSADPLTLYNVTFSKAATFGYSHTYDFSGQIFTVLNDLSITAGVSGSTPLANGTFEVKGNIITNDVAKAGSALIKLNGAGAQTYSQTENGELPTIEIDKVSGTVTPAGGTSDFVAKRLILTQGSFTASPNFTRLKPTGSGNIFVQSSGSTFNHNNGTVIVEGNTSASRTFNVDIDDPISFNNFTFSHIGSNYTHTVDLSSDVINVLGDLLIQRDGGSGSIKVDNGTLSVSGDITIADGANGGSAQVSLSGTSNQLLNHNAGVVPEGVWTVEKSSGQVLQASNVDLVGSGQGLDINNGDWDMKGYDLNVNAQLNIGDGIGSLSTARLYSNCGALSAGVQSVDPADGELINSDSSPNITISDESVNEGGDLVFTVTLSEAVCSSATNINYTTDDDLATVANLDYTDNDNILVIPAKQTTAIITVSTITDTTMEFDETLYLNLTATDKGAIIDSSGIGEILNDDDNGYIWTGDMGDNNWHTAGNWSGLSVPPSDGTVNVMFDGTCADVPANCDVNTSGNIDTSGFWVTSAYPGTVTASSGNTVRVRGYWLQNAGTFTGVDSNIDFDNVVVARGGFLNFPSTNVDIHHDWNSTGATINAGTSTTRVQIGATRKFETDGATLNNLSITGSGGGLTLVGSTTVAGDLYVDIYGGGGTKSVNGGILELKGDVTHVDCNGGTALFRMSGSGTQTINGYSSSTYPNIEIASTGTVNLSGNVHVGRDWTYVSGTVNEGASTVVFEGGGLSTITSAGMEFNNVQINKYAQDAIIVGTMVINGNLSINNYYGGERQIDGGTIEVKGNVSLTDGRGGSATIKLVGSGVQTLSGNDADRYPSIEIASTGTVNLVGIIELERDWTYTSGTVDAGTSRVDFSGGYLSTINSGAMQFNNVVFQKTSGNNVSIVGNAIINGYLNISNSGTPGAVNGDTLELRGNLSMNDGNSGSAQLLFSGINDQTISKGSLGNFPDGTVTVNKPSGNLLLSNHINFDGVSQSMNMLDGDIYQGAYNLTIANTLTMSAGTTINKVCRSLTVNSVSLPAGPYSLGTIVESSGSPNISIADAQILEGGNLQFDVTMDEVVCSSVSMDFNTNDNTATTAALDYVDNDNTLTISSGSTTGSIIVDTNTDLNIETDETLNVVLSNASHGSFADDTGVGTIEDDPTAAINLSVGDVADSESAGTLTFTFTIDQISSKDTVIDFTTEDLIAVAGTNYTTVTSQETITAGTLTKTTTVPITNTALYCEQDRTFKVKITGVSKATLSDAEGIGTIEEDDFPTITLSDVTVTEGDIAGLTVTLSQSCETDLTLDYATSDNTATVAAGDYTLGSGQFTIESGLSSKLLGISTINDFVFEAQEDFNVTISNASAGTITDPTGVVTVDDDDPNLVSINTVTQVSAGDTSTCAVVSGGAKCWGHNVSGQLGDGTNVDKYFPVDVSGLTSGVIKLSSSSGYRSDHHCAIVTGDALKCWGSNQFGKLGIGVGGDVNVPTDVVGLSSGVTDVSTGFSHSCAVVSGGVKCWGSNLYGQLGDGSTVSSNSPVDVSGLTSGVAGINVGSFHSCAVLSSGAVKCWGRGNSGQLGDNSLSDSNVPVDVSGLSSGVTNISSGHNHACAVVSGSLKCWGLNNFGQLGDGTSILSPIPVQVSGLTSGVVEVSAGGTGGSGRSHTCALLSTGAVKCWGANTYGELGEGSYSSSNIPVDVSGLSSGVTQVSAGTEGSCAIQNGYLKCWGHASRGQYKNHVSERYSTRQDVLNLNADVTNLTASHVHTCAVQNGGAKCWGSNSQGQLGDGTSTTRYSAVDVSGLTSGVVKIEAGGSSSFGDASTCAVTSLGAVKCWGRGNSGQLGNGANSNSSTPVDVTGLSTGVVDVSVGNSFACALLSTGAVKCWGMNSSGELGNNSTVSSNIPVDVTGLSSGVVKITAGASTACAIMNTGALKCWGSDQVGQLGQGSSGSDSLIPLDVPGLSSGVTHVSSGGYSKTSSSVCAIVNGVVKCWGYGSYGVLGDGMGTQSNSPIDVVGLNGNAISIMRNSFHACAVIEGGETQCWGRNYHGEVGDGTEIQRNVATSSLGVSSGAVQVVGGYYFTCIRTADGAVKCWGSNGSGQAGVTGLNSYINIPEEVLF